MMYSPIGHTADSLRRAPADNQPVINNASVIVTGMQPRMGSVWLFFGDYKTPSAFAGSPAGVRSIVRVDRWCRPVASTTGYRL
jgi:hypothetical protein